MTKSFYAPSARPRLTRLLAIPIIPSESFASGNSQKRVIARHSFVIINACFLVILFSCNYIPTNLPSASSFVRYPSFYQFFHFIQYFFSLWRRTLASSSIFCLNDYLPCALNIRVSDISRIWMRLWKCDARVQQLRVNIVCEDAATQVYRLMYASISVHLVFTCGGGIKYRINER